MHDRRNRPGMEQRSQLLPFGNIDRNLPANEKWPVPGAAASG
jgi:hypothetical protein